MQNRITEEVEPVWVRPRRGAQIIGCGLTKFYELLNTGKVKSINVDGMRLANVASIKTLGTAE